MIERFQRSSSMAEQHLDTEDYQQAIALYYDASQSADEICERFFRLLIRTAPDPAYRTLFVETLCWRLRYYMSQYEYHLAVARTLTGLPRDEWLARIETILILSQSLVAKLLSVLDSVDDRTLHSRVVSALHSWVAGIRKLVSDLKRWGMSSAQASQVLEWALDNGMGRER
ncbi:MAG: hypothetical protein QXS20_06145 [Candidatus Thorarchaeota archaeon]